MKTIDIAVKVATLEPELLQEAVRALYRERADPCGLMGDEIFTLRALQELHEAVTGESYGRDTFRRRMLRSGLLQPTELFTTGDVGKPARYYRKP